MSATYARKKPFLRLATAAVAMVAALGMAACSGGASTSSSSSSSAQVGDRSPEQIKEAGEIVIGIFSDKAPSATSTPTASPPDTTSSTATASPPTWA